MAGLIEMLIIQTPQNIDEVKPVYLDLKVSVINNQAALFDVNDSSGQKLHDSFGKVKHPNNSHIVSYNNQPYTTYIDSKMEWQKNDVRTNQWTYTEIRGKPEQFNRTEAYLSTNFSKYGFDHTKSPIRSNGYLLCGKPGYIQHIACSENRVWDMNNVLYKAHNARAVDWYKR